MMNILCRLGYHAEMVYGTGMMGDGTLCLCCGRETYGSLIGRYVVDLDTVEQKEIEEKWSPRIETARKKPRVRIS